MYVRLESRGLLVTFDFHSMADEEKVINIASLKQGENLKIEDVDVILSVSQWKLHSLYHDDWSEFEKILRKNDLDFGIQRIAPYRDKDSARLNYQLIQTSNIQSDEDIHKLIQPTQQMLQKSADRDKNILIRTLVCEDEEQEDSIGNLIGKVIKKNPSLINDAYVQNEIQEMISSYCKLAKTGKLLCNANYQYMISDPVGLAQWALYRDKTKVKGLIPPYNVYSRYWMDKGIATIDACRSPITDISEHNILTVCDDSTPEIDKMKKYYSCVTSGIV